MSTISKLGCSNGAEIMCFAHNRTNMADDVLYRRWPTSRSQILFYPCQPAKVISYRLLVLQLQQPRPMRSNTCNSDNAAFEQNASA